MYVHVCEISYIFEQHSHSKHCYSPSLDLFNFKGTDHVGTFMGLKCVVYYANYRSGNQSSKIQVVP